MRFLLYPVNFALSYYWKNRAYSNSVLHISYMVHIPYYTVQILRRHGIKADYMAIGASPVWDKSDFTVVWGLPFINYLRQFYWFWSVVVRYEVVHSHFMIMISSSGWELPLLKKMGRRIVINYRGCEIRDRKKNMMLHPEENICEDCDYWVESENKYICELNTIVAKRHLAEKYGDVFLVTTPDMKDFVPNAVHFPFFVPEINEKDYERLLELRKRKKDSKTIKIVHVTNHPGIEGTEKIKAAIECLRKKGIDIDFVFLKGVPHERVFEEYADADLSIGKMKMGYYANAQIESMMCGVPAITHVRPEFMTEELRKSAFIFTSLDKIEETIEFYIYHPEELGKKKLNARESIFRLHDNDMLAHRLIDIYHC